jgi:manganese/zinc/iron transport system substrate-binding protein
MDDDCMMAQGFLRFTSWLLLAVVIVSFLGCDATEEKASGGPYTVVCTVGMVSDVVRQVAGERAKIVSLLGTGVDPHSYRPTRDDIVQLQKADVVFYAGLRLEGKLSDVLQSLGEKKPVFAVADAIDPARLLSPEGGHGAHDPHVWMDASLWTETAGVVAKHLSAYDPTHAAEYEANAKAFVEKCKALHDYGKSALATVPPESRLLVTSHDAFSYFGRAYNIEVMGVQGISTESEANIKSINALVDLLVARKVKAVFVESSVSAKNVQAIIEGARSRGHPVIIGGELYSDAMGEEGTYEGTYLGMIDHNITIVTRALGGQAPAGGWQGKLKQ